MTADLDHRLVQLGLDLLVQDELTLLEHLRNVRAQLSRLRVDDLIFFLDADRQGWRVHPTCLLPKMDLRTGHIGRCDMLLPAARLQGVLALSRVSARAAPPGMSARWTLRLPSH